MKQKRKKNTSVWDGSVSRIHYLSQLNVLTLARTQAPALKHTLTQEFAATLFFLGTCIMFSADSIPST